MLTLAQSDQDITIVSYSGAVSVKLANDMWDAETKAGVAESERLRRWRQAALRAIQADVLVQIEKLNPVMTDVQQQQVQAQKEARAAAVAAAVLVDEVP